MARRHGPKGAAIAGSAVAVLAVIVVAFVVQKLFGGDDVSVSDPIAIGHGPLRIATGERSVWVTSARDGTLSRIDVGERLGRRAGRCTSNAASPGVAVGARSVWVASPRTGEVLRDRRRHAARSSSGSTSAAAPARSSSAATGSGSPTRTAAA